MKKALILGITGMDGSYLADILLEKGYEVHGMVRRSSTGNLKNIEHILPQLKLHNGDMSDPLSIQRIIAEVMPDEIYNEADQDHVGYSYDTVSYSGDITGSAVGRLLEIVRTECKTAKVFIPLSATMFGNAPAPQNVDTAFNPQSPYAVSKVTAYYWAKYYREHHGMFVTSAILYNHDSVRRTGDYLLHKICKQAVDVQSGKREIIKLTGGLGLKVDVGYARDYMLAVYCAMQQAIPASIMIGSGVGVPVSLLVKYALEAVGISGEMVSTDGRPLTDERTLIADLKHLNTWQFNWPTISAKQIIESLVTHYRGRA